MVLTLMMSEGTRQDPDPKIIHWVWDDDPDESCCGRNMAGTKFIEEDGPEVDCVNCLAAVEFIEWLEGELDG